MQKLRRGTLQYAGCTGVEPLLTAVLLYLGFGFRFLGCTCEGVRDTWVFGERVESQELARWTLESGPGIAEGIVD
jgi:hypothetical protein